MCKRSIQPILVMLAIVLSGCSSGGGESAALSTAPVQEAPPAPTEADYEQGAQAIGGQLTAIYNENKRQFFLDEIPLSAQYGINIGPNTLDEPEWISYIGECRVIFSEHMVRFLEDTEEMIFDTVAAYYVDRNDLDSALNDAENLWRDNFDCSTYGLSDEVLDPILADLDEVITFNFGVLRDRLIAASVL